MGEIGKSRLALARKQRECTDGKDAASTLQHAGYIRDQPLGVSVSRRVKCCKHNAVAIFKICVDAGPRSPTGIQRAR